MSTHLSRFFRQRRINRKLRSVDLARLCGYRNTMKGCNRIQKFEERGTVHPDLFHRLQAVLEIDDETVSRLIEQDQRAFLAAWLKWVNEPVRMLVRRKRMPAFIGMWAVPEEIATQKEAEIWACSMASEWGPLVLHISRKVRVAIDEEGKVTGRFESSPDSVAMPYQQLGRHRFRFVMGQEGMGLQIEDRPLE